jgi:hypothetical protein
MTKTSNPRKKKSNMADANEITATPAQDQEQNQDVSTPTAMLTSEPGQIFPASEKAESEQPQPVIAGLDWLGHGAIVGIPARNLSAAELAKLGLSAESLVKTGLYRLRFAEAEATEN